MLAPEVQAGLSPEVFAAIPGRVAILRPIFRESLAKHGLEAGFVFYPSKCTFLLHSLPFLASLPIMEIC
jgi:hypothetical protein